MSRRHLHERRREQRREAEAILKALGADPAPCWHDGIDWSTISTNIQWQAGGTTSTIMWPTVTTSTAIPQGMGVMVNTDWASWRSAILVADETTYVPTIVNIGATTTVT